MLKKRVLAILVCLLMVAAMLPTGLAALTNPNSDGDFKIAVKTDLSGTGINPSDVFGVSFTNDGGWGGFNGCVQYNGQTTSGANGTMSANYTYGGVDESGKDFISTAQDPYKTVILWGSNGIALKSGDALTNGAIFIDSDSYSEIWIKLWGGTLNVTRYALLDADGDELGYKEYNTGTSTWGAFTLPGGGTDPGDPTISADPYLPTPPSDKGTSIYNMQTDVSISGAADDSAFAGTNYLTPAGDGTKKIKAYPTLSSKSIHLSGRYNDYDSVDIKINSNANLTFDTNKRYTFFVTGRTALGATVKIMNLNGNSTIVSATASVSDGTFSMTTSYILGSVILANGNNYRIQTQGTPNPTDLYIDGIHIFEDSPPANDDRIYYNMFTDAAHMASSGTVASGSMISWRSGGPSASVANNNVKSVKVAGRTADWHSAVVKASSLNLVSGTSYKFIVKGRVINLDATKTTDPAVLFKMKLSQTTSPWSSWSSAVAPSSDGSFTINATVIYGGEATIGIQSESGVWNADPLISTANLYCPDYYIDSIVIMGMNATAPTDIPSPTEEPTPPPADTTPVIIPDAVNVTPVVSEDGSASVEVKAEDLGLLIAQAKAPRKSGDPEKAPITIAVELPSEDTKAVDVSLPAASLNQIVNETKVSVIIDSGLASAEFDTKALRAIIGSDAENAENIKFSFAAVEKEDIPVKHADKIGDRPVFDFSVSNGDNKISDFNGGKVTINIPYQLAQGEVSSAVVPYYIADDGSIKQVIGKYRAGTGTVGFTVTHFSVYAVGYNLVEFTDVAKGSTYYTSVTYLASRGVTLGVGNGKFGINEKVTRGMFIVMLLRAFGIEPDASSSDNFSDAGNTWYTGYLAAAKRLGITQGVGDNKFAPDQQLTEWQLETLLSRTLKELNCPPYAVKDTASETNIVNRGHTARVMYNAINNGFFNASVNTGPAVEVPLYVLAEDSQIKDKAEGTSMQGTTVLQNCAATLTIKDYNGGKSVAVGGRTSNWNGLDIRQSSLNLEEGETYKFSIKGHVEGDVPDGAAIKITATNSSGQGNPFITAALTSNGEFVMEDEKVAFAAGELSGVTFFRINTDSSPNVTFIIDSITISRMD